MDDHAKQVRSLFDSKAARWPDKYTSHGRLAGRLMRLSEVVGSLVAAGGDVLDFGCGSGDLARHLAAQGYAVTGCDIAPQMLGRARAADATGTVCWIELGTGWRRLPLHSGVLDCVVASSVLEYVPDPADVLLECARVLRPGGTLLCSVPDVTHPVRWLEWALRHVASKPLTSAASRGWPRLGQYLTYLRMSHQRRRNRWWLAVARGSGLRPVPLPDGTARREPLRLLAFTRTTDTTSPA